MSYAESMIASMTVPGYDTQSTDAIDASQMDMAAPAQASYKIPPALWMVIFLVVGYFGLRMILED